MSLTNPKIFGLNVKSELTDVKNKNTALRNLGINPLDLEIIKGSVSSQGMSRYDWFSFSRLQKPIHKNLTRFLGESSVFTDILDARAGTDQTLFGNLDINGSISGSSIRYRFLKDGNAGKLADISTSRVSAWSSSDPRAKNSDLEVQKKARISYGARVSIVENGKLEFGTQSDAKDALGNATSPSFNQGVPGPAGEPRLQTTLVPEVKEFDSEVPTSKIKCNINGQEVFLYAMKGIPLTFEGKFRNCEATAKINYSSGGQISASWKVVEVGNVNKFSVFRNRGTSESDISFSSPVTRKRFIKFYYNPVHIQSIKLRSVELRELPATKLENCTELDFAYNKLKLFPNFAFIAPKLRTISLMRNPFYQSDNEFERKFNNIVLDKLKCIDPDSTTSNIRVLNMEGTFPGSIERHLIPSKLPNLTALNFARGAGATFTPDDRSDSGLPNNAGGDSFCPDIPDGVTSYSIQNNDFYHVDLNAISPNNANNAVTVAITNPENGVVSTAGTSLPSGSYSFKTAQNLTSINVYGNYSLSDTKTRTDPDDVTTENYNLASKNKLTNLNFGNTSLALPNLQGASVLSTLDFSYNRAGTKNPLVDGNVYLLENCNALTSVTFYSTNLGSINFPQRFTNTNLETLDLRGTHIKGGTPGVADAAQTEVISTSTFSECVKLKSLYIYSEKLLAKPIASNAFAQNVDLELLDIQSGDRIGGDLPSFSTNSKLKTLVLPGNNFSGNLPNFGNQKNTIHHVNVENNSFSGDIPGFANLTNLRELKLNNNAFDGNILPPNQLPNLYYYYAYNNQLTGQIPDFSTCTNLRELSLFNNLLSAYFVGSFRSLYRIKYFDLSNNRLTQTAQDNIIFDLYENWNAIKRGGVTINLRGNVDDKNNNIGPSDEGKEKAIILVGNGWNVAVNGGLT